MNECVASKWKDRFWRVSEIISNRNTNYKLFKKCDFTKVIKWQHSKCEMQNALVALVCVILRKFSENRDSKMLMCGCGVAFMQNVHLLDNFIPLLASHSHFSSKQFLSSIKKKLQNFMLHS